MDKLKVLFLCTGNSCRSQMAEGWARHLKSDAIDAWSAGVEPHGMNARAVHVMAEAGVDISRQSSKHVDTLKDVPFDYVVTVCGHANETCPMFPGSAKVIHVGFDDPPALAKSAATEPEALAHYRRVRDEIRDWVMTLPESLTRTRLAAPRNPAKNGILVLCSGNTARSQMAEGFLKSLAHDRFDVHSAGMTPGEQLHPLAVQVMREAGIDIRTQWPKSMRAYLGRGWFKYVIIVCPETETSCPRLFIGAMERLFWPFENPAAFRGSPEQQLARFRELRDQIHARVRRWLAEGALWVALAEFLGTFALVFAGTGAVVIDNLTHGGVSHVGIALTFGLVVMAMIYALGDISGAHLNPAVSIGFALAGRLPVRKMMACIGSQFAGALLASAVLRILFGNQANLGATLPAFGAAQSFLLEIILTAILMFVILFVATGSKEVGTMAGIAIGGVVGLEALFAGPISGASMNPARSLAPAVMSQTWDAQWIYLTAPVLGAAVAVVFWRMMRLPAVPPLPNPSIREENV